VTREAPKKAPKKKQPTKRVRPAGAIVSLEVKPGAAEYLAEQLGELAAVMWLRGDLIL
jgi:hypothetical protein